MLVSKEVVDEIKKTLPELPCQKKQRYIEELGLPAYDAKILTSEKYICDYFEKVLSEVKQPKVVSNWIMTEVLAKCKEQSVESLEEVISVKNLAYIIKAVQERLGHSNTSTTMNIYTHATEKMSAETVDIFEKAIKKK